MAENGKVDSGWLSEVKLYGDDYGGVELHCNECWRNKEKHVIGYVCPENGEHTILFIATLGMKHWKAKHNETTAQLVSESQAPAA